MNRFDGKVALVTGGGDGMGAASVKRLSLEGATVYALDIVGEKAHGVEEGLRKQGRSVFGIQGDVTEESDLARAFQRIDDEQGRLDVLVDVAGGSQAGFITDLSAEDWEQYFRLNVVSTATACRLAVPRMKTSGGGSIVVMSSISGVRGDPGWAVYNTAKAALINFTECLAWEVGALGSGSTRSVPAPSPPSECWELCRMILPTPITRLVQSDVWEDRMKSRQQSRFWLRKMHRS